MATSFTSDRPTNQRAGAECREIDRETRSTEGSIFEAGKRESWMEEHKVETVRKAVRKEGEDAEKDRGERLEVRRKRTKRTRKYKPRGKQRQPRGTVAGKELGRQGGRQDAETR